MGLGVWVCPCGTRAEGIAELLDYARLAHACPVPHVTDVQGRAG